jgi:hypothetical protein
MKARDEWLRKQTPSSSSSELKRARRVLGTAVLSLSSAVSDKSIISTTPLGPVTLAGPLDPAALGISDVLYSTVYNLGQSPLQSIGNDFVNDGNMYI